MKTEEEETQKEHKDWQAKMAAGAKRYAQLEINLRIEDLKRHSRTLPMAWPLIGAPS